MNKTNFPKKNLFGNPKGWEDRGEVSSRTYVNDNGQTIKQTETHSFCKTVLHIGAENCGQIFKYCPKCLVKCKVDELESKRNYLERIVREL